MVCLNYIVNESMSEENKMLIQQLPWPSAALKCSLIRAVGISILYSITVCEADSLSQI